MCATYVHLPFENSLLGMFTRNVKTYKDANYELLNKTLSEFEWTCLHEGSANEAIQYSHIFSLNLLN